jgi:hypothetical protein
MKAATLAAIVCIPIGGCASFQPSSDGSCKIFRPISNSQKDTEQTRREVVAHNKVYGAICPVKG